MKDKLISIGVSKDSIIDLNIDWVAANGVLSKKDLNAPFLKDSDINF